MKTLKYYEDLLSNFDLLLSCIESDCGTDKLLKNIKSKIKLARTELHNIPIPKRMK